MMITLLKRFTLCLIFSGTVGAAPSEINPGGKHTHYQAHDKLSFSHPPPTLSPSEKLDFQVGKAVFEKIWVFAPSSTTASDGLGPLYNARSCARCHKGNGRGMIEEGGSSSPALFLRLSIPPQTPEQKRLLASGKVGFIPEPIYGKQLQTFAYPGGRAEGQLNTHYTNIPVQLNNGDTIKLRKPSYTISNLGYGEMSNDVLTSPRIAPPMIGLGLLDIIEDSVILEATDPNDLDKDGVSGRANRVWDEASQSVKLGRFGWKAGTPTLAQQNNAALSGDIGISSEMFPEHTGDCTKKQKACLEQKHGNRLRSNPDADLLEASKTMTDLLLHYTQNIAVPKARLVNDHERIEGKKLFHLAKCDQCHRPSFNLAKDTKLTNRSTPAEHTIWPYTDLLLHDMGAGLADNRPEFEANGQEWRTPPLWGIGLTKTVNGNTFYLHDGRAKTLLEAILWHGGEAEASKNTVINMQAKQRKQLIKFLESL